MPNKEIIGVEFLNFFLWFCRNKFIMVNWEFYKKDNSKERLE
jgi:hypothetical protein